MEQKKQTLKNGVERPAGFGYLRTVVSSSPGQSSKPKP